MSGGQKGREQQKILKREMCKGRVVTSTGEEIMIEGVGGGGGGWRAVVQGKELLRQYKTTMEHR